MAYNDLGNANQLRRLTIARRLASSDPTIINLQRDISDRYYNLARASIARRRPKEGLEYLGQALAITQRLAASDATNLDWQLDLSKVYEKIGVTLLEDG